MTKVVDVVITRQTTPVTEKSFSIPCLFTSDASSDSSFLVSTSRNYSSLPAVAADFATSSDTYKAIQALLSQTKKPAEWRIFRRAPAVARVKTLSFDNPILTGQVMKGVVNGVAMTDTNFTTDSAGSLTALATKIATMEGVATASVSGSVITVTASSEWDLSLSGFNVTGTGTKAIVTIAQTVAGKIQADDLADAIAENKDWYAMLSTSANKGAILCSAKAIQSEIKIAVFKTNDSDVKQNVTTDVISKCNAAGYDRTTIWYTHDTSEMLDCALVGNCLPVKPGAGRWGLQVLSGPTPSPLTDSEKTNILAKNGNVYTIVLGINVTEKGRMANGDYVDVIRDLDYVQAQLILRVFLFLVQTPKVPFIDEGILSVDSVMKGVFHDAFSDGIIKNDYTTNPPKASTVSVNTRANRILPDLPFAFNLQGGIEAVGMNGIVKV